MNQNQTDEISLSDYHFPSSLTRQFNSAMVLSSYDVLLSTERVAR